MKILLAPMEGVVDSVTRELLTEMGGIDYCTTEFIRVTSTLLPEKVFYRYCPELKTQSKTKSGTPVFVQILGSDLTTMPENAQRACELGAFGIDINFGCPAKTVNRHDGGSALLKNPERIYQIASGVRAAMPSHIPMTVKVRLGFSDKSRCHEIALAAEAAGAHWLTVHGRTKEEGYRPPAHWHFIAEMKNKVKIPVIANGEIWTPEDHKACLKASQCDDVMIGRGLIARPDLARQIKLSENQGMSFGELKNYVTDFMNKSFIQGGETFALHRTKQLIKLMARTYPESAQLFEQIKREQIYFNVKEQVHTFFNPEFLRISNKEVSPNLLQMH